MIDRDTVFFTGEPAEVVESTQRLARDLAAIARGDAPTRSDLESAPHLDAWNFSSRRTQALLGELGGASVTTGELFVIGGSGSALWARTWSAWYRLGQVFPIGGRDGG